MKYGLLRIASLSSALWLGLVGCASSPDRPGGSAHPARPIQPGTSAQPLANTDVATPAVGERVIWWGGPTALIERGGFRLLTDPMLGSRSKRAFVLPKHPSTGAVNAPVARFTDPPSMPLGALDAVLVSHGHADHFDDVAKEVLPKDVLMVVPPHIAAQVQAAGFRNVKTLDWGQTLELVHAGSKLTVSAVPAHHAHDPVVDGQSLKVNGYVLSWEGERGRYVAYWTGDSVTFPEQAASLAPFRPLDLLLPHVGAVGSDGPALKTMDADELDALVAALDPRVVIPIHHTTFGHYREPVSAVEQHARRAGWADRLIVLPEGGATSLAPR